MGPDRALAAEFSAWAVRIVPTLVAAGAALFVILALTTIETPAALTASLRNHG